MSSGCKDLSNESLEVIKELVKRISNISKPGELADIEKIIQNARNVVPNNEYENLFFIKFTQDLIAVRNYLAHHPGLISQPLRNPSMPRFEERIFTAVAWLFDAPTREDLSLICCDLARLRKEEQAQGRSKTRITFLVLSHVARALFGIVVAKVKTKLEPVLRFWR